MHALVAWLHVLSFAPPLIPSPSSLHQALRLLWPKGPRPTRASSDGGRAREGAGGHGQGPGMQDGRPPSPLGAAPRTPSPRSAISRSLHTPPGKIAVCPSCSPPPDGPASLSLPAPPALLQVRMQHCMRSNCYIEAALREHGSSCLTPRTPSLAAARVKSPPAGFEVCWRSRRPPDTPPPSIAADLHELEGHTATKLPTCDAPPLVRALALPLIRVNINRSSNLARLYYYFQSIRARDITAII